MATAAMMAMRSCSGASSAASLKEADSIDTALDSSAREWGELKVGTTVVAPEGDTSGSSESLG
jgi:hypothetical protein